MSWSQWSEMENIDEGTDVPAGVTGGIEDIVEGRTVDGEDFDEALGL